MCYEGSRDRIHRTRLSAYRRRDTEAVPYGPYKKSAYSHILISMHSTYQREKKKILKYALSMARYHSSALLRSKRKVQCTKLQAKTGKNLSYSNDVPSVDERRFIVTCAEVEDDSGMSKKLGMTMVSLKFACRYFSFGSETFAGIS